MTIKELIAQLQAVEDKEKKVIITVGNEDDDTISTSDFVLFGDDCDGYIEIFIDENNCTRQL